MWRVFLFVCLFLPFLHTYVGLLAIEVVKVKMLAFVVEKRIGTSNALYIYLC